jgi:hypothetical protein
MELTKAMKKATEELNPENEVVLLPLPANELDGPNRIDRKSKEKSIEPLHSSRPPHLCHSLHGESPFGIGGIANREE